MNRARGINEITRRNAGKYDKRASNVSPAIFKSRKSSFRNSLEILKYIFRFKKYPKEGSKLFGILSVLEYRHNRKGTRLRNPMS